MSIGEGSPAGSKAGFFMHFLAFLAFGAIAPDLVMGQVVFVPVFGLLQVLTILYGLSSLSAWAFHGSRLRPRSIVGSALYGALAALPIPLYGWALYVLAFAWPFLGLVLFVPASRPAAHPSRRWAWALLCVTLRMVLAAAISFPEHKNS